MKIEFAIKGDLQKKLQKALRKSGDLSPIMKKMGAELQRSTAKTFRNEGERGSSPFGFEAQKWKGLKDSTKKWRKRIGHSSSPILTVTGNLRGSITYEGKRASVKWGPSGDAPYGKYHQFGTKNMVKRPFIGFHTEDHAHLVKTTKKFIRRIFR